MEGYFVMSMPADILPVCLSLKLISNIGRANILYRKFNPLNAELNPICYLLALLGAHHFL